VTCENSRCRDRVHFSAGRTPSTSHTTSGSSTSMAIEPFLVRLRVVYELAAHISIIYEQVMAELK